LQSAKPREDGGSVTGQVPTGGRSAGTGTAADGNEAQIQAALARNPDDVDARLALAHLYLFRQDWTGVLNQTARVLERAPGHPQALVYQAVGFARMGRMQDAQAAISNLSKRFPDRAAELRRLLAGLGNQEEVPEGGSRLASSGRRISGTVDIDPSLASTVPPGAVLFVFVREAGAAAGPPVAVKRLPARFPATFELSEADSMMGRPFPDAVLLEARLDSDGDPTTRPATDPRARIDRVKAGRTDLHLVLRRP
jgi:hypothetical protein